MKFYLLLTGVGFITENGLCLALSAGFRSIVEDGLFFIFLESLVSFT